MEGAAPSRKEGRGPRRSSPGEDDSEEEENIVEEEGSDCTEASPPVGASQDNGGPTLAWSNQPSSNQSHQFSLAIMQQMTHIMSNLEASSSPESSRPPAFKTPYMKAPDCFDVTQPFKVRIFIQSCQLIFYNDKENLSEYRKQVLYDTSFLIGRAEKWIEPYLSNLINKDPAYLLNNWALFESQVFTLFGEPNEVRTAEAELNVLRMKEGGHGLASINLEQLASHPSSIDYLQELMDLTLETDTREPPFPSSVHIPSFNYHWSLLSSRNEVLKEIQDVGEYNSVSSLHLFLGNVEPPTSSYHDFLEELWDEEEEPEETEAVINVVPSAYHPYLDIFSKVKAEKLSPHQACDHHIKLEGLYLQLG
ncbi:hypothetical protein O181_029732 [Austropuccinia psidii MF-1]|uniref:DUF4939 domain-containing protein n=1 Tax=Austropuccinia psidii MF-1 TaxID=1389203 RepID=A0A9Q3H3S6_9BASI|nr:hypothetical protein [Austropuccinia psidii MF-1]